MLKLCVSLALFAFATAPVAAQARPAQTSLQGVWRPVEVRMGAADSAGTASQPGLYIFTGRHYSIIRVTSAAPRPDVPADLNQATAAQLIASWNPFTANSGTYQVSGSELMTNPVVSKDPPSMTPGAFVAYDFALKGDTLTLTPTRVMAGPITRPTTIRLVRVE